MKMSKRVAAYRKQRGTFATSKKGHTYTPKQRKRMGKKGLRFF